LGCSHWTCMHPRSRDAVTGRQLLKAKLNWLVNEAGASTVSAEAATPEGRALLDFKKFKARTNYRE